MTTTSKIALSAIVAGAFAIGQVAQATPINGSVSFSGNVTAYVSTTGTGTTASGYNTAGSLVFGTSSVNTSPAPSGSFTGTGGGSVSVFSPLVINPIAVPTGTMLWTITSGTKVFQFTLNAPLSEVSVAPTTLVLQGTGVMSDNVMGDTSNAGTWIATFTSAQSQDGVTFSWNSSSAANVNAPEAGTSVLLLGLGLAALGAYAQFRKQQVA